MRWKPTNMQRQSALSTTDAPPARVQSMVQSCESTSTFNLYGPHLHVHLLQLYGGWLAQHHLLQIYILNPPRTREIMRHVAEHV